MPPNSCQWEQSQLGLQHLPAGEGTAPREHIPPALLPADTAPHHKSPLVTFPGGNQPASSKNASITNKNLPLRSPVPLSQSLSHSLSLSHSHSHTHTHTHTHTHACAHTLIPAVHSQCVGWAGGQKLPPAWGTVAAQGRCCSWPPPPQPPSGQENYFRLFFCSRSPERIC